MGRRRKVAACTDDADARVELRALIRSDA